MKIRYLIILLCLFHITNAYGAWEGPTEIVGGIWGSEAGRFGFKSGDSADSFPREFEVDQNGEIVISDEINKRVQIFNASGGLKKVINKPVDLQIKFSWPLFFKVFPSGNSILTSYEGKVNVFDYSGAVLSTFQTQAEEGYATSEGYILGSPSTKTYSLYSPTGQLIRTTTERPLELGKVKEKKTATGYTYTIQYPDLVNPNTVKTYTVSVARPAKIVTRDRSGNLYITTTSGKYRVDDAKIYWFPNDIVYRFDTQNNLTGNMQIPDTQFGPEEDSDYEPYKPLIAEYGEPVIAPNGDVYTWKRTPTTYSIIKWTWR